MSTVTQVSLAKTAAAAAGCFEVAMTPGPERPAQARRMIAAHAKLWRLPDMTTDSAMLVSSELVTNAVVHGKGSVGLRVTLDDGELRIEVSDESSVEPQLKTAADDDLSGRGLLLVAMTAGDWGVINNGRTVWAVLPVKGGGR
ncbi:ATP-binding protein [Streptomyces sp. NPDC056399]|uniref:ATP-binding protein n=1 Tax=Streptomyces sp. NPDC056399 TaxID=3345807 RepID=UPI0035E12034